MTSEMRFKNQQELQKNEKGKLNKIAAAGCQRTLPEKY